VVEAEVTETPPVERVSAGPRRIDAPAVEPVDLLDAAGTPILRRLLPVGIVLAVLVVVMLRRRSRS
jgi:hypothetical protein